MGGFCPRAMSDVASSISTSLFSIDRRMVLEDFWLTDCLAWFLLPWFWGSLAWASTLSKLFCCGEPGSANLGECLPACFGDLALAANFLADFYDAFGDSLFLFVLDLFVGIYLSKVAPSS